MHRRDAYENDFDAFMKKWRAKDTTLRKAILTARTALPLLKTPGAVLHDCASLCIALGSDGLRGELTLLRAARAYAAFEGATIVTRAHLRQAPCHTACAAIRWTRRGQALASAALWPKPCRERPTVPIGACRDRFGRAGGGPGGGQGLWLRTRAGAARDRVTAALPAARRIHPGIDDTSLFGGVDLVATLANGQLVRSRGLLSETAP